MGPARGGGTREVGGEQHSQATRHRQEKDVLTHLSGVVRGSVLKLSLIYMMHDPRDL